MELFTCLMFSKHQFKGTFCGYCIIRYIRNTFPISNLSSSYISSSTNCKYILDICKYQCHLSVPISIITLMNMSLTKRLILKIVLYIIMYICINKHTDTWSHHILVCIYIMLLQSPIKFYLRIITTGPSHLLAQILLKRKKLQFCQAINVQINV